jgi:hypothetical protein
MGIPPSLSTLPAPSPTDTLPRTVSAAVGLVRSAPVPVRPGHAGSASAQGLQRLAGSIGAPETFASSAQGQCPVGGFCDQPLWGSALWGSHLK